MAGKTNVPSRTCTCDGNHLRAHESILSPRSSKICILIACLIHVYSQNKADSRARTRFFPRFFFFLFSKGLIPFVPGYRQAPFTVPLLKSQRAMSMLLLARVQDSRHVIQGAGRRVQEHRSGRAFRRAVARGLHGLDLEPVKTGPRLWYSEILVVRAHVREERRARLQGLHGPPRLRYVVN